MRGGDLQKIRIKERLELAPVIQTVNLTHVYSPGTPFEQTAVDNVDFAAERGEFIGIIGHTGSGKSTFIQHLNGLLKPSSGRVLFNGEDIFASKQKTRETRFKVGLVFQYPEYQLFEETVYRDIAFGPKNMGLSDEEIDRRVRDAAGFVDISEDQFEKSPFDLSGGQKRRVAIAGVIAMKPDVLILDEPTAGLDPMGREEIIGNIVRYHNSGENTVIFITHSMEDIARIAGRLVVFSKGRIFMDGTPKEVFSRAEDLRSVGLDVPDITLVMMKLKKLGLPVDDSVYTVEQAKAELLKLKGRGKDV
ncbi:MAG: energy-coupling factor transporter ATPase [Oscillospiraceae bacterium]|nr:energy-coupling factor transporter ATPase [Oscillospiraceae bacterium]